MNYDTNMFERLYVDKNLDNIEKLTIHVCGTFTEILSVSWTCALDVELFIMPY